MRITSFIIGLGLVAGLQAAGTTDLYVPRGNSVSVISAREVNLNVDSSLIPLALNFLGRDKDIDFFSSVKKNIERMPLDTLLGGKFDLKSLIINQSKLYLAEGNPRRLIECPTDADSTVQSVAVTPVPNNNRLCILYEPPQNSSYTGSECMLADSRTGKPLITFPLDNVYAFMIDSMVWISEREVLCMIYSRRGNGGFIIDTQSKSLVSNDQMKGVQYFSMTGSKLMLYSRDGQGNITPHEFKFK